MHIIPYGKQSLEEDDINAVVETLKSPFLTQGPKIPEFENAFKAYVGSQYALAISNGTTALHLAYEALGVKKGDLVITTPITFAATSNAVLYCGGDVIFADIDPETFNISLPSVLEILKSHPERSRIKGIAAVDFAGLPLDWVKLRNICDEHKLWLLEDSCHALGAEFLDEKGRSHKTGCGLFADISVFSFHPVKHIACGEGGMLTTNNQDLYQRILLMRTHGITRDKMLLQNTSLPEWYYEMQDLGFNYRMTDIQGALGLSQLKRIISNVSRRREIAEVYRKELAPFFSFQKNSEGFKNSHHLFVILTKKRDELYAYLKTFGIYCQVHYIPVHLHPFYKTHLGQVSLPKSEDYFSKCLSIPMYHSLKDDEQAFVIEKLKKFPQ